MQENGTRWDPPIERDLAGIFWSVLCRWKLILLAGLLVMLVTGGSTFYQSYKDLKDPKTVAKQEAEYRTALENYEKQKHRKQRIEQ